MLPKEVARVISTMNLTGCLHEVQVQNLKIWAKLGFPEALHTNIKADVAKKTVQFVLYEDTNQKMPTLKVLKHRMKGISESVHYLLGDDFHVSFQYDGKTIFKSSGTKTHIKSHLDAIIEPK